MVHVTGGFPLLKVCRSSPRNLAFCGPGRRRFGWRKRSNWESYHTSHVYIYIYTICVYMYNMVSENQILVSSMCRYTMIFVVSYVLTSYKAVLNQVAGRITSQMIDVSF